VYKPLFLTKVDPGNEALTDLAEEVVLEAVRNTELRILLADLIFKEVKLKFNFKYFSCYNYPLQAKRVGR
jgi:hypothetical protein